MDRDIILDDVIVFSNDAYKGLCLQWHGNIGWGEYNLYKANNEDGWHGDSECLDSNEDKGFLTELLAQFIDRVQVDE